MDFNNDNFIEYNGEEENNQTTKIVVSGELVMKKETLLNAGYLPQWGLIEACKEFTQNYVFALQHLHADGITKYEKGIAIWEDYGKGFDLSCLLMGVGEQKSIESAPGENSEGQKISLLIAAREGKQCSIEIPGYTIIPMLENGKFGANELVLNVYANNRTNGVKYTLECDKSAYKEAISNFGFLVANQEDKHKFSESSIIDDKNKCLYINGVKINGNLKFLTSYNLVGKALSNRDRNAISPFDINRELWEQIISVTTDVKYIRTILTNANDSTIENFNTYPYYLKQNNKIELWRRVIKDLYGSKVCFATGGASDTRARYRNFKVIKTPCRDMQYVFESLGVPSSELICPSKEPKQECMKLQDLDIVEKDNLSSVRKLIKKFYFFDMWNIRYVKDLKDNYENDCFGICNRTEKLIYLNQSILRSWDQTFKTLLHEVVHQVSEAEDCTAEFENEWERACLCFAKSHVRGR